jgi:hypothetical protein
MSLALLVASGDLEAPWVGLELSTMPLLGGPVLTCGGVERFDEGSRDRQRASKKNEMDTREGERGHSW